VEVGEASGPATERRSTVTDSLFNAGPFAEVPELFDATPYRRPAGRCVCNIYGAQSCRPCADADLELLAEATRRTCPACGYVGSSLFAHDCGAEALEVGPFDTDATIPARHEDETQDRAEHDDPTSPYYWV
jgi:hypothetical protein